MLLASSKSQGTETLLAYTVQVLLNVDVNKLAKQTYPLFTYSRLKPSANSLVTAFNPVVRLHLCPWQCYEMDDKRRKRMTYMTIARFCKQPSFCFRHISEIQWNPPKEVWRHRKAFISSSDHLKDTASGRCIRPHILRENTHPWKTSLVRHICDRITLQWVKLTKKTWITTIQKLVLSF